MIEGNFCVMIFLTDVMYNYLFLNTVYISFVNLLDVLERKISTDTLVSLKIYWVPSFHTREHT